MEGSDCKSCHQENEKSIGPSYLQVAGKYKEDDIDYLASKIINGGGGVWGEQAMAAHPQISQVDAEQMAAYILSLNDKKNKAGLPLTSTYTFKEHLKTPMKGTYFIKASYTDKGGGKIGPLSTEKTFILRSPVIPAKNYDDHAETMTFEIPNTKMEVVVFMHGSHASFENIDLTAVNGVTLIVGKDERLQGGEIELRSGSPEGPLLGKVEVMENNMGYPAVINFDSEQSGFHDLYLVGKAVDNTGGVCAVVNITFNFREEMKQM